MEKLAPLRRRSTLQFTTGTLLTTGSLLFLTLASSLAMAETPAAKPEFDPAHAEKMAAGLELFKSHVRGILIEHCIDCHGGAEVESGLDLATRKGLMRGGSHGPSITSGKSADSNLVRLIAHKEEPKMPEGGDRLPDEAIAAITKWIDLGAPYDLPLVENPRDPDSWTTTVVDDKSRQFWSFQPLKAVAPPTVKNSDWPQGAIDQFVLAKLEEKNLAPASPADRRVLIRRAYFDLIGLPPTPEEVEAFVGDQSAEAFEKVVNKLLDNPHYGERWGRHWLDIARFAESHGFEQDYDRPHAYHYRDFVIRALASDMPFDQFVRWQLAGDEIAPHDPLAMMATGFLGAGVFPTQITANEVERTRYDSLDDMASTTTSAMLGLSVGCARCHDHKFDPIPQADYYRMAAIFTTTIRSNLDLDLDPADYNKKLEEWNREHQPISESLARYESETLRKRAVAWLDSSAPQELLAKAPWRIAKIENISSTGKATFTTLADQSVLASGANADFDTYTFDVTLPAGKFTAIRLEALADASLPHQGPGRADNGNIALTDVVVALQSPGSNQPTTIKLLPPKFTFQQPRLDASFTIDSDPRSAWAVDPQFGRDHALAYPLASPIETASGAKLKFTLRFENNKKHTIGRLRMAVSESDPQLLDATPGSGLPAAIAQAIAVPAAERKEEQVIAAMDWLKRDDVQWKLLHDVVAEHDKKKPQPNLTKVMVCSEGVTPIRHHTQGADFFNETYFLKRGDCEQKMGVAQPGYLQVLSRAPAGESHWLSTPPAGSRVSHRRTSLANWITDTELGAGELLARVIVNRLWHHHFGRGIVSTPNDFGLQGTLPTHPELLDHLASQLIANKWHLKSIHRAIMLSATYQQSSAWNEDAAKIDPENSLRWRWTPRRMEAEIVRDNILAAGGLLDKAMFGPGTLDDNHKRRSIYFTIKRSRLIPMMQLFDQPEPLVSVGGRPSTTVAPQALALLNSPIVRDSARSLGKQLSDIKDADYPAIVDRGYLLTVNRLPDEEERTATSEFLKSQEASYTAAGKTNARELALTDFAQVLMGLSEFVYIP